MSNFKKFCFAMFGCGLCTPNAPSVEEVPVVLWVRAHEHEGGDMRDIETGKTVKVSKTLERGTKECSNNIYYDMVIEAGRKLKSAKCGRYFGYYVQYLDYYEVDKGNSNMRTNCWFRDEHRNETTAREQIRDFAIEVPVQYDGNIEFGDMILFSQTIGDKNDFKPLYEVVLGGISYVVPRSVELSEFIEAKLGLSPGEYELHLMSGKVVDPTEVRRLPEEAEQFTETARNNYYGIAAAACKIFSARDEVNTRNRITEFVGMMKRLAPNTCACEHVGFDSRIATLTRELSRRASLLRYSRLRRLARSMVMVIWDQIHRYVREEVAPKIVINIVPKSNEPTSKKSAAVDGDVAEEPSVAEEEIVDGEEVAVEEKR